MKISIVMAYHNRKPLLQKTLQTIAMTAHKDFEVIIVDDCSDKLHELQPSDLSDHGLKGSIITISDTKRWWHNSCVPYNIGFKHVDPSSEIVIIQNPECVHVGDILTGAVEHVKNDNHVVFGCYSCNAMLTDIMLASRNEDLDKNLQPHIRNKVPTCDFDSAWYNHSRYRRAGYHFCAALTKDNLFKLNGFDNRYARGHAYDDDDLVIRVKRLGLRLDFVDRPYVLHLEHGRYRFSGVKVYEPLQLNNNQALYTMVLQKESGYRAEDGIVCGT